MSARKPRPYRQIPDDYAPLGPKPPHWAWLVFFLLVILALVAVL